MPNGKFTGPKETESCRSNQREIESCGSIRVESSHPWWFFSILLGISFYAITGFYEGLCLAFVYDLIYASSFGGTVVPFVMTFLASVLFLAFISFRKFIR